jgi:hypothetical protein
MKIQSSHRINSGTNVSASRVGRHLSVVKITVLLLLSTFAALTARASDPVGIYALVDKVVFEPSDSAPERIQIWGAFALAEGRGYQYEPAKRGYLYYKLNSEKKEVCLKEWADLKSVAGTKKVVGFGARYEEKGKVRAATEKPSNPDVFPIGFGLTKMRDVNYAPVKELLGLSESKKSSKENSKEEPKKSS